MDANTHNDTHKKRTKQTKKKATESFHLQTEFIDKWFGNQGELVARTDSTTTTLCILKLSQQ